MKKQVLIVDDDVVIRRLYRILLEHHGYDVLVAADAYEALDLIETESPDAFIVDMMMPGMNGLELCRELRAQPQTQYTPVVMLSAMNDDDLVAESVQAGVDLFVGKATPGATEIADSITELIASKPPRIPRQMMDPQAFTETPYPPLY